MISAIDFLKSKEVSYIISLSKISFKQKEQAAYNLFTLSSYNNHYENFHSDVIASLLSPNGLHKEGRTFLVHFIAYLNNHFSLDINPYNFSQAEVYRENGRLDIWIKDKVSMMNIIIENKINNAADIENQVTKYHDHVTEGNHGQVAAILYLSLDGLKEAPPAPNNIQKKLRNIAAFTNSENDLVNGWLNICKELSTNDDSKSLIHQYIKLIKQIAHKRMDDNFKQEFYNYISTIDNLDAAKTVVDLISELPTYRRDKFHKTIGDPAPFKNLYSYPGYGNRSSLFMNYHDNGFTFKLDVWFVDDGSARVWFWIPGFCDIEDKKVMGLAALKQKLEAIKFLNEFQEEDFSFIKYFTLEEYKDMIAVDNAVLQFVKHFLQALRN